MISVVRGQELRAAPQAVFAAAANTSRWPALYERVACWERLSGEDLAAGSRSIVLMHAGSVVVRSVVQVKRHEPPYLLSYASVSGIPQAGRIEVARSERGSRIVITVQVALPGGLLGRIAERYLARILTPRLDAALLALKRHLEFGDPRA